MISPIWLWAAVAAIGLPVLIHLLSRFTSHHAIFPSLRLLEQVIQQGQSRSRWQDYLLLLMRIAALLLVVLALSGPIWRWNQPAEDGSGQLVIHILDRSASMTRTQRSISLFELARNQTLEELAQLNPGMDRANVILVDRRPGTLTAEPTGSLTLLRDRLMQITPSSEAGDLAGAMQMALGQVESDHAQTTAQNAPRRRATIHWHSDMQATQTVPDQLWQSLGAAGVSVVRRPVGQAQPNLAIRQPVLMPAQPVVGQTVLLTADLAWHGIQPGSSRMLPVTLEVQGRRMTRTIPVRSGATTSVGFEFHFTEPGVHHLRLGFDDPGDGLPQDNQTGLFVHVQAGYRVILATAADADDPQTCAFYAARAFSPDAPAGYQTGSPATPDPMTGVILQRIAPRELANRLSQSVPPHLVMLVEGGELDAPTLAALDRHLRSGGSLAWVIDSPQALHSLAKLGQASPWEADAAWRKLPQPIQLSQGKWGDPLLSVFEGSSRSALMKVGFASLPSAPTVKRGQTLLSLSDDTPWLCVQWVHAGRLALLLGDLSPRHSDLVKHPAWLPLLQQLVGHLAPSAGSIANPQPGDAIAPARLAAPLKPDHLVLTRSNSTEKEEWPLTLQGEFDPAKPSMPAVNAQQAGAYAWWAGQTLLGGVQVDLASAESDLSVAAVQTTAASGTSHQPLESSAPAGYETSTPGNVDLWPWCLALALLILMGEQAWLWKWNRQPAGFGRGPGR